MPETDTAEANGADEEAPRARKIHKPSYILGILTGLLFLVPPVMRAGHKLGYGHFAKDCVDVLFFWRSKPDRILKDMTPDMIAELKEKRAVIEKAGNPTDIHKHSTMLVKPDKELAHSLRPNVEVTGDVLTTRWALNLNPPVLYMKEGTTLSPTMQAYLKENSRLRHSYSTNAQGQRRTVPEVAAEKKILLVGDSVCFGVGVNDDDTVASKLQQMTGDGIQFVNGGVGAYNGKLARGMAQRLAKRDDYDALVYIACQNDFSGSRWAGDWIEESTEVMNEFAQLKSTFGGKVVVIYETFMEHTQYDILMREGGWPPEWHDLTRKTEANVRRLCEEHGMPFLSWTEMVEAYRQREKSIFAGFALYTDHCHLSAEGNRLMAEAIYRKLAALGAVPAQAGGE